MTQNRNDSLSSILQHGRGSISYFRLSIFDPASQTVQVEISSTSDVPVKKNTLVNDRDIKVIAMYSL